MQLKEVTRNYFITVTLIEIIVLVWLCAGILEQCAWNSSNLVPE